MGKRLLQIRPCAACGLLILIGLSSAVRASTPADSRLLLRAGAVELNARPSLLNGTAHYDAQKSYLLQLDGPMSPTRRAALEATGVALSDYLPHHTWRVDLQRTNLSELRRLPFVTWLGEFDPSWKICSGLAADRNFKTPARQQVASRGLRRIVMHLARESDPAVAENAIAHFGGVTYSVLSAARTVRVLADVPPNRLHDLCVVAGVEFIEEAPEAGPRNASTAWIAQSNLPDATTIWDRGLHGEQQIIHLIDWDLDENHCTVSDDAPFGNSHRKIQAYYGFNENTLFGWHGTHVAGVLLGEPVDANAQDNLFGMAYAARLVFHDQAATITATNLAERLAVAHADGARVHSNSWGANFDNSYNAWAHDVDAFTFANEDDIVIFAVINGGDTTPILSPENAKNCLAVGASGDAPNQDAHGSGGTGPTPDGRQKPEVWLPGCNSNSAEFGSACETAENACATSWAAPAVSGMASLTRQYFTDGFYPTGAPVSADALVPSGALIKAVLINSAVDMAGFAGYFGPHEGWGRILLDDALYFTGDDRRLIVHDVRHAEGLVTGASRTFDFAVTDADTPLKITLVWSDAPATIGAAFAPVNDIDLVVTAPDGSTYLGNHFDGSESVTGGDADTLNNAEQVHRHVPEPGVWHIEVAGSAVNVDMQGFAVVVTGGVEPLSAGNQEADLAVAISPSGPLLSLPGDIINIKLLVSNMGPTVAHDVAVNFNMPTGLSLIATDPVPMPCTADADSLECVFDELNVNAELSIPLRLRVEALSVLKATATISSAATDPVPANNTASLTIEQPAMPDLEIVSIVGPTELLQGESGAYIVTVRNNGIVGERVTELTFALDDALVFESRTGCNNASNGKTCALGVLSAGASAEVTCTFRAKADATGQLSMEFFASGMGGDETPGNNTLTFAVTIIPDSDQDGVADKLDICDGFDDAADADGDGVPDGCDECPGDPLKSVEGICGCDIADTDNDGDGIPNCGDQCPDDPHKLASGACGCGVSDEDADGNGVPDCEDTPVPAPDAGMTPDALPEMPDDVFRLEDLDPCLVRYLLQSLLGIPMCGPCISFGLIGTISGMTAMRRRFRRAMRRRR